MSAVIHITARNGRLMKHKNAFMPFIISTCLTTSLSMMAFSSAAAEKKPPRWFEIEVILFQQLGDKTLLKEQFNKAVALPKYKRSFDLLSSYLQPDISSLKQKLPLCSNRQQLFFAPDSIIYAGIKPEHELIQSASLFKEKSLSDISSQALPIDDSRFDEFIINGIEPTEALKTADILEANTQEITSKAQEVNQQPQAVTEIDSFNNDEKEVFVSTLSAEQIKLISQAERYFEQQAIPHYQAFPNTQGNRLCQIPYSSFAQLLTPAQLSTFKLDGFPVEKTPKVISASGHRNDASPYLINKDSLLLGDMITRLRWSKNFRPLMHLGWRQIGITRTKAIPMQFFAGKHLQNDYQQALNSYQYALALQENEVVKANIMQAPALDEQVEQQQINPDEQAKTSASEQLFSAKLAALINQAKQLDTSNSEDVIKQLGQEIQLEIATEDSGAIAADKGNEQNLLMAPLPPIQPWELTGLFKVHLDHYLYITADFNIAVADTSLDGNSNQTALTQYKQVNFSQDRRVISGEVHYFDHPYIGMIVQIRRFDPSKPADEAVSQAVR
ncbi:hypothetical protein EMK97_00510 [Litorilituus sediminis]|uniref:Uncharacterized protein n=2 Tax=Litorilituus sediminis TaxID=718192 RepID=A0A4P6P331_9GAMM|nr:hypothetical protein EMK97_00510 [Litorilituus sediminis]